MAYEVVTKPNYYPISLSEVKTQVKLDPDDNSEDLLLELYISAATSMAENFCRRFFMLQTLKVYFDGWQSEYSLAAYSNVLEVESVSYLDENGSEQVLGSDVYEVDYHSLCPKVIITGSTPTLYSDKPNAVIIQIKSGFIDSIGETDQQAAVPAPIKIALFLQVSSLYSNRNNANQKEGMISTAEKYLFPYITKL